MGNLTMLLPFEIVSSIVMMSRPAAAPFLGELKAVNKDLIMRPVLMRLLNGSTIDFSKYSKSRVDEFRNYLCECEYKRLCEYLYNWTKHMSPSMYLYAPKSKQCPDWIVYSLVLQRYVVPSNPSWSCIIYELPHHVRIEQEGRHDLAVMKVNWFVEPDDD